MAGDKTGFRIGALSGITGLTPDTLRFYERLGVLDRPARTSGRFRIYDTAAIERIQFIKRAKALGFSLDEIHQLIGFNGKGGLRRCGRVRDLLTGRLAKLEAMLAELSTLHETLKVALAQCEIAINTENPLACPVIELGSRVQKPF